MNGNIALDSVRISNKSRPLQNHHTRRFTQLEQRDIEVVSLFSGCGGMDLGFQGGFTFLGRHYSRHPFKINWACEINDSACRTYRQNVSEHIRPSLKSHY